MSRLQVVMERESTQDERDAVVALLERYEVDADLNPSYTRMSATELPWLVELIVTNPLGAFVTAFATTAGAKAASLGSDGLRRFVSDIYEERKRRRSGQDGDITLEAGFLRVPLRVDLPAAAYAQLSRLEPYTALTADKETRLARWHADKACWQILKEDNNGNRLWKDL